MHFSVYKRDSSWTEGLKAKLKKKVITLLWKMTGLNCIVTSYFYPPLRVFDNSFTTIAITLVYF